MINYLRDYNLEKKEEEDEKQMPYYKEQQGLTWRNDPLLFDPEPLPVNQWLNANALIEAGRGNEIFLDFNSLTLNLFPILIRRSDFLRMKKGDRIIARFPFLELTTEEKELIKSHILLIAEKARIISISPTIGAFLFGEIYLKGILIEVFSRSLLFVAFLIMQPLIYPQGEISNRLEGKRLRCPRNLPKN